MTGRRRDDKPQGSGLSSADNVSPAPADDRETQQPPARGAGLLILLQLSSRLLTLAMAQVQVRLAAAEAFGAAHIHLELLLGIILMFSREGVRNALARQVFIEPKVTIDSKDKTERIHAEAREHAINNVAMLPIPGGLLMTVLVVTAYSKYLAPDTLVSHPQFTLSCLVFAAGAATELLAEPLYTRSIRRIGLGPRVAAEGLGVLAKSVSTLGAMLLLQYSNTSVLSASVAASSLLPFAVGQLCYGVVFFSVFAVHTIYSQGLTTTVAVFTPQSPGSGTSFFDPVSIKLAGSMTRQNIVKHILGEADKLAVTRLASLSEQGAYALASNYASLVARLLYQPIEESARLSFAITIGSTSDSTSAIDSGRRKVAIERARDLLVSISAFYALMASFLISFCPLFTKPLLLFIAGERWAMHTSAPAILTAYGVAYLPVMAFNGLLEGFVQASASSSQLARYDAVLLSASALFVSALGGMRWICSHFSSFELAPEIALVLASSISTALRAGYCLQFAKTFFRDRNIFQDNAKGGALALTTRSILPSTSFLRPLLVTCAVLNYRAFRHNRVLWELPWATREYNTLIMGSSFLVVLGLQMISSEQQTLRNALAAVRGKR